MRARLLAFVGAAAVLIGVIVLAQSRQVSHSGAGAAGGAANGQPPKTAWGAPDLQGIWTSEYFTPFERPARYADREFFTEEEIAELDKERAVFPTFTARVAERGTVQDLSGAYDDVFQSILPTGRRTSLIVDPPNGRIPPLTPQAQKMRSEMQAYRIALMEAAEVCKSGKTPVCAGVTFTGRRSRRYAEAPPRYPAGNGLLERINRSDGPEDRGRDERCLGGSLPEFGGYRRIVQSPTAVALYYDLFQGQGYQRVIPITTTPHAPSQLRQWRGDSRGRWEGDTLVVDVTNFTPKTEYRGSRENLHLIERWTRVNAKTLEYSVTVDDPTTWTKPWTVKQEMTRQDERQNRIYYEPRCHKGNYGRNALLAGARADEKAFRERRGP